VARQSSPRHVPRCHERSLGLAGLPSTPAGTLWGRGGCADVFAPASRQPNATRDSYFDSAGVLVVAVPAYSPQPGPASRLDRVCFPTPRARRRNRRRARSKRRVRLIRAAKGVDPAGRVLGGRALGQPVLPFFIICMIVGPFAQVVVRGHRHSVARPGQEQLDRTGRYVLWGSRCCRRQPLAGRPTLFSLLS